MELLQISGDMVNIQFSLEELVILNNALNEICNGLSLPDFEAKIGVSWEEARMLLKLINELLNPKEDEAEVLETYVNIHIKLPKSLYRRLKKAANSEGMSIYELLETYMQNLPEC